MVLHVKAVGADGLAPLLERGRGLLAARREREAEEAARKAEYLARHYFDAAAAFAREVLGERAKWFPLEPAPLWRHDDVTLVAPLYPHGEVRCRLMFDGREWATTGADPRQPLFTVPGWRLDLPRLAAAPTAEAEWLVTDDFAEAVAAAKESDDRHNEVGRRVAWAGFVLTNLFTGIEGLVDRAAQSLSYPG